MLIDLVCYGASILSLLSLFIIFYTKGEGLLLQFSFLKLKIHNPIKPLLVFLLSLLLIKLVRISFKDLILVFISLLFSFVVVEVALRFLDLPLAKHGYLKEWRRPSESLGWELIPNVKGITPLGYEVSINSQGLRDEERPWNKPDKTLRIFAAGDSFTFGYGLPLEDTYVKQLQRLLSNQEIDVDVINGGVVGYNLYQSIHLIKEIGLKYIPDIVLYFFYLDDVGGIKTPEEAKRVAFELSKKELVNQNSKLNSYLLNLLKNSSLYFAYKYRTIWGADWLRNISNREKYFLESNSHYLEGNFDLTSFKNNLTELRNVLYKNDIKLLIVIIPDAIQLNNKKYQKINQIVLKECEHLGIPYLDITPIFESHQNFESLYLFPVDAHTSKKGNELIAKAVSDKLAELSWVPSKDRPGATS